MKMKQALFLLLALAIGCTSKSGRITKTGILVVDGSRNHTSFDYFIPCPINDTLTLIDNLKSIHPDLAINMRQHKLDFNIMANSWPMTQKQVFADSTQSDKLWYVSAVEIAYREEGDMERIQEDSSRLGGILLSRRLQTSPRNITLSVKQFIFAHP
ncbi:hypothetical protein ACFST9_07180 [Hymenobacter monticola]|uniref:Lipoprotein n=1 Tax=Hymenobacter monticola TaxID=1705399 RepID=A0ABY4B7A7_9BACT|nr:hypothetical protein [Hymenobacter monticola]UOE33643.1 hypothetical protein MTP16_21285 [Hymenobacter monticola]